MYNVPLWILTKYTPSQKKRGGSSLLIVLIMTELCVQKYLSAPKVHVQGHNLLAELQAQKVTLA